MEYRKFGRTGWDVSEIAFGAWQLGGQWGDVDDEQSVATLTRGFEAGINFVDTAEMYGSGRSERVVGEALRRWTGQKIRVATKIQPVYWPLPSTDTASMDDLYPPTHLRDGVESALRRLGAERIDLLQLHCWVSSGMRERQWLDTLQELQSKGLVDRIGVSLRDYRPDEGAELAAAGLVDSIQVIFNVFEQRPLEALLPAAEQTQTAIMARVALDSGSLSGAWTPETYATWQKGSVLHTMFRDGRFIDTLKRVDALKALTAGHFPSLAEAAIRYALHPPAVSTVIVGMSTPHSLARTLKYSYEAPYPAELAAALPDHQWNRNFYV